MSFQRPTKPSGTGPNAHFMMWVWEYITGWGRLIDGPGYKVNRTTQGASLILAPQTTAGTTAAPTSESVFHFKKSQSDYIETVEGVSICKIPKLWCSIATETIYGNVINFTYPTNKTDGTGNSLTWMYRVASLGGSTENEGINPQYLVNDLIIAGPMPTGLKKNDITGKPILWMQSHTSQAWTRFGNPAF